MDCNVTCVAKPGTTYNMVVFGEPLLFKGGNTRTVHESIGNVLEKVRDDFGKLLFKVEYWKTEEAIENIVIPDIQLKTKYEGPEVDVVPSITIETQTLKKK